MSPNCLQLSFGSIRLTIRKQMWFEDGCHGSWLSEQTTFSNSESLCCSDASHQVSVPSNLRFRRCRLKNFKMADMAATLDIRTDNSESPEPPVKFRQNLTHPSRVECQLMVFKMATMSTILDIGTDWATLAVLNLHVTLMPPTKFQFNWLTTWQEIWFEEFQDKHYGANSWISE